MQVSISPAARNELKEIHDFIALDNPIRAESFAEELLVKAHEIINYPYIFAPLTGFPNIRKRSYKGYIILFEIADDTIQILHIINSYRNYASILKKPKNKK